LGRNREHQSQQANGQEQPGQISHNATGCTLPGQNARPMATSQIPIEIDAPMGPRALDELGRVLIGLGYDPRSAGRELGEDAHGGQGGLELFLKAGQQIAPDAADALVEAVSTWVRQRPVQRGRFRRRHARPVTVTVQGPGGEVLSRTVVQRD
jgi:hypothetical protein